ncbi:hypothetical protein DPEC_G00367990 [Dallia pectoralis]|nr:hypothetical protein DPEC_G00367990 [Dallia pectoralis]
MTSAISPDSLQTSLKRSGSTVFEEELEFCEQEWVPSLGEEDPEITQIKSEQEELQTSQEEEQFQGNFGMEDSIFTSPCLKSECDPEDSHFILDSSPNPDCGAQIE